MVRCTYLVFIYNNERNISRLIDSLTKINGPFIKEFIFIDDGSKDKSLEVLKNNINQLSRAMIITQKESVGSTISIHKVLNLTIGNYIHFVEGDEVIHPDSTKILVEMCTKFGAGVSFGKVLKQQSVFSKMFKSHEYLIEKPINEILLNKIKGIRNIGCSATMINTDLIGKIHQLDSNIYTHNMSLALKCAKYSKFVFTDKVISIVPEDKEKYDSNFITYNNIRSIYNFVNLNKEIFINLVPELLTNLANEVSNTKLKLYYYCYAVIAKYSSRISLDKVLGYYKKEFQKLF